MWTEHGASRVGMRGAPSARNPIPGSRKASSPAGIPRRCRWPRPATDWPGRSRRSLVPRLALFAAAMSCSSATCALAALQRILYLDPHLRSMLPRLIARSLQQVLHVGRQHPEIGHQPVGGDPIAIFRHPNHITRIHAHQPSRVVVVRLASRRPCAGGVPLMANTPPAQGQAQITRASLRPSRLP